MWSVLRLPYNFMPRLRRECLFFFCFAILLVSRARVARRASRPRRSIFHRARREHWFERGVAGLPSRSGCVYCPPWLAICRPGGRSGRTRWSATIIGHVPPRDDLDTGNGSCYR
ncbi:hypothetical protein GQ53DRAFT_91996 [Thozetella sp. PMI_491]|nr:hypothetical protein GQ53DRAFT_91996 [Thozetella sp. PMI_491]